KIETNQMAIERIPFTFSEVIGEVFNMLAMKAREKGITLDHVPSKYDRRRFLGDPLRIRQVLMNLVSNAIKFTEKGGVTVGMDASPHAEGGRFNVRIAVKDTGIGIDGPNLENIFEKFTQGDTSI